MWRVKLSWTMWCVLVSASRTYGNFMTIYTTHLMKQKITIQLAVVAFSFNLRTQEAEVDGSRV